MRVFEKATIQAALKHTHGNVVRTATRLGIPLSTLKYKMKRFKIKRERCPRCLR